MSEHAMSHALLGRTATSDSNLKAAVVGLCVAFTAFTTIYLGFSPRADADYSMTAFIGLNDLLLWAVVGIAGPSTVRRLLDRQVSPLVDCGALLSIALIVSSAVHPAVRGFGIIARLVGAVVVADWISQSTRKFQKSLALLLTVTGLFEYGLAVTQLALGHAVGLGVLGEFPYPFVKIDNVSNAPTGTFFHCYVLSGFIVMCLTTVAMLTIRGVTPRRFAYLLGFASGSSVVFTFARVSLLSLILAGTATLIIAATAKDHRKFCLTVAATVVVGAAVTFPYAVKEWTVKANRAGTGDVGSGRANLLKQNIRVFERFPLTGVGTGRYTLTIADDDQLARLPATLRPQPPHNVVMSALTESGLLSVPALAFASFAIAAMVWRRQWVALIGIASAFSPLMVEQYPWNTPEGMLMIGIGFGTASIGLQWRRKADSPVPS